MYIYVFVLFHVTVNRKRNATDISYWWDKGLFNV